MNRYDVASVAKFNPLSYQEIMAAPLAMRQKHDNAILAAEAMRIKANPLDKHLARAVELKNQMDAEIAKNVDTLNKEGYNPTTFQNITKLNRQYQDMISPTGEIGQINNSKIVYDKAQEDFIQDAAKQNIGRDRAINLWKEKTAYYTGFGEDGKSITNVSPQGVAAYQDYEKYKQVAKSLMGEVESESRNGGYKLKDSGLGNGSMVMVDSKGFQKKSTNLDALNNAIIAGNEMWLKPTGEGYKYNQDAGVDQNNFKQRFIGDFGSMLKTSRGSGYEKNGSFINDASGPNGGKDSSSTPSAVYDPSTQKTLTSEIKETDYSKIGTNRSSTGGVPGQYSQNTKKVKIGYKDLLKDPVSQRLYEKSYDRLVAAGKIPKGADKNSEDVGKIVGTYMTKYVKIPTIANDVILPDTTTNSQQFMGEFDRKTGADRDATAQTQLSAGYRSIIDPVSGKELTPKEFRDKGYTVKYIGYDSHLSYNNYGFKGDNNKNQSILSHKVEVLDEKGKSLGQTPMTRSRQEMENPEFKKSYQIGQIYRNALQKFGDWVIPTSTNNTKVKFKENGKFDIIYDGNLYEDVTGPEYEFIIDKAITEKASK